jgi:DNA polymerase-1
MKKHVLMVDGNSIAHANHNATVLSVGGFQVQAIFGMLKSLRAMLQAHPGEKELAVLWDGKAQWRMDMYPEYKANRVAANDKEAAHKAAFKAQTPLIEKAIGLLGVRQMRSPLLEADDLAGYLAPRLSAAGHKVTMFSGDKDWIQLVDENVTWDDPIRDRRVTPANFLEFTGYATPAAFVQGKALVGDDSDNITGIPGFGDITAQLFMARWKHVPSFFQAVTDGTYTPMTRASKKAKTLHPEELLNSAEGREQFMRNVKLMDLKRSRKVEPGELISTKPEPNPEGFLTLCERLSFASILREQTLFLKAFNITKEIA